VRLAAYTDNWERGGADLSLSYLLEGLDDGVEVAVLGVATSIVEWEIGRASCRERV